MASLVTVAEETLERVFSLFFTRVMNTLSACRTSIAAQEALLMLTPLSRSRTLSFLSASTITAPSSRLPERR